MYLNLQDDLGCFIYNNFFSVFHAGRRISWQRDQGNKFPRIIGSGEFWDLDLLSIAVEGECVLDLGSTSMTTALSLLVACMASL